MERNNSLDTKKKMTVLPPDPVFRFKSLGHLHCLCFVETLEKKDDTSNGIHKNVQNVSGCDTETMNDLVDKIHKTDLANAPAQKVLMAAGEDGIVYFFDLEKNRLKFKQQMGHSIQMLHSFKSQVIVQEKEGLVTIFRPTTHNSLSHDSHEYEAMVTIPCASGFCRSVHLKITSQLLIPQENAIIKLYDLATRTSLKHLSCIPQEANQDKKISELGQLMCLEFTLMGGNPHVFAGFETGAVYVVRIDTEEQIAFFAFEQQLISLTFDPVAMRGVVGGAGNNLEVFALDRRSLTLKLQCVIKLTNPGCVKVKVRQDRKVLVCGGFDGRARIYSWKTLRLLAVLLENHETVTDVQFSDHEVEQWGSRIMAVAGADGIISLWCLYN